MGCRGCLLTLAIVSLIVVGLVGAAGYLATQPSPLVADMPPIAPSEDAALAFDDKWDSFLDDVGSTSPFEDTETVTVEITEEEATSKLSEAIRSQQFPVNLLDPQVRFRSDRVQASVNIDLAGVRLNTALQAQLGVRDERPDITIETLDLGRLPMPELVRYPLLEAVAGGTDPSRMDRFPFKIDSLGMTEGVLTITAFKPPKH